MLGWKARRILALALRTMLGVCWPRRTIRLSTPTKATQGPTDLCLVCVRKVREKTFSWYGTRPPTIPLTVTLTFKTRKYLMNTGSARRGVPWSAMAMVLVCFILVVEWRQALGLALLLYVFFWVLGLSVSTLDWALLGWACNKSRGVRCGGHR